jgi:pentatricopeptide repeat protein
MMGVENTLLDAYTKRLSRKLFDEMTEKDVVSWNSMIAVYAQIGLSIDAFEFFHGMLKDGGGKCGEFVHFVVSLCTQGGSACGNVFA